MLRSSAEWVVRGLPPVYASRSPAPLTRGRRWRAAPNRGFCLPAPSGAPMASTPSGGERREVVSGNRSRGDSARDAGGEGRSRGACGQSVTGVRSGGRTPGRVAERWPSEAETPERRAHTPCAASPGGYEAAPRRQHREAQDAEDNIGGYYAGLGWRGRLISHAPQLGRTGGVSLLPPVYASRSPAPLTRGRR